MDNRSVRIKQVVPLLLLTHGLGVLAGFAVFCFLFQTQCADRLQAKNFKHGQMIMSLQIDYEARAIKERAASQRTMVSEQTALIEKCQSFFHTNEAANSQIRMQVAQLNDCAATITVKDDGIARLTNLLEKSEKAVTNAKRLATKEQEMLKSQLTLTKTMLQQHVDELCSRNGADIHGPSDSIDDGIARRRRRHD